MTQYGIRITFDDGEMQTLERALCHYLDVCQREIKNGGSVPFIANSGTLKRFRARLRKEPKPVGGLTLNDSERLSLENAFSSYLGACEREIATGATEPFIADRAMIEKIRADLSERFKRAILDASVAWAARRGR